MKSVIFGLGVLALAQAAAAADIQVGHSWARATLPGMSMGGVFMQVVNGDADNILVGGSSPVAEKVEIHTHINDNGVMRMRELEGGLPLPQNKAVELKPGSYHIMLMGLKAPLTDGQTFPLTLRFKQGKAQTVTVTVHDAAYTSPTQHHQMKH